MGGLGVDGLMATVRPASADTVACAHALASSSLCAGTTDEGDSPECPPTTGVSRAAAGVLNGVPSSGIGEPSE